MMRICGFNKTTLLDYPGKVASTIFLGGCNFRCPFCQNSVLVLHPEEQPDYAREDILAFLKKRKGILDGVCISGGEPTLAADLEEFLEQIKDLGYLIKLDTNGTRPEVVKHLAEVKLIDKVAVDIKSGPDHYSRLAGVSAPAIPWTFFNYWQQTRGCFSGQPLVLHFHIRFSLFFHFHFQYIVYRIR